VLSNFPLLCGRARKLRPGQEFVDCGGQGVRVREQRATFYGGDGTLTTEDIQPHLNQFCGAELFSKVNDPSGALCTITLTEVDYAEAMACRPPAACRADDGGAAEEEGKEDGPGRLPTGAGTPVRYAIGISISHGIADGCSVALFLLAWAAASCRIPLPPVALVHERGKLLEVRGHVRLFEPIRCHVRP
jgi:hypothetical protein